VTNVSFKMFFLLSLAGLAISCSGESFTSGGEQPSGGGGTAGSDAASGSGQGGNNDGGSQNAGGSAGKGGAAASGGSSTGGASSGQAGSSGTAGSSGGDQGGSSGQSGAGGSSAGNGGDSGAGGSAGANQAGQAGNSGDGGMAGTSGNAGSGGSLAGTGGSQSGGGGSGGNPPSCGDGDCNGTETCSTCSEDCGVCLPTPCTAGVSGTVDQITASGAIKTALFIHFQDSPDFFSVETPTMTNLNGKIMPAQLVLLGQEGLQFDLKNGVNPVSKVWYQVSKFPSPQCDGLNLASQTCLATVAKAFRCQHAPYNEGNGCPPAVTFTDQAATNFYTSSKPGYQMVLINLSCP
jgi:hypothetical protein